MEVKHKKIEEHHEAGGEGESDESAWLTSYADMMTVLCCFFIILVSMANFEEPAFQKLAKEVGKHFDGKEKPAPGQLGGNDGAKGPKDKMETMVDEIAKHPMLKEMSVVSFKNGELAITFSATVMFSDGGYTINDDVAVAIDALIDIIKTKDPNYNILVEGHSDNQPLPRNGPFTSNWALAGARAASVIERFEYFGFDRNRLRVVSVGDTQPLVSNEDKKRKPIQANLKMNRRVVIKVIEPKNKSTAVKIGLDVYFDQ